mgnify:FL=1
MSKRLKLFGLLALTLALGAGVAWAFDTLTLSGNNDATVQMAVGATSTGIITGNGTQRGGVDLAVAVNKVLRLNAAKGNVVTLAPGNAALPGGPYRLAPVTAGVANNIQVAVNTADAKGKVVMKASDGDNPTGATMTEYTGGTVQESGTLGVTNGNALGQAWVGVVGNYDKGDAPVFQMEGVNELQLGFTDPNNNQTDQPFFLLADTTVPTAPTLLTDLRYVTLNSEQTSVSNKGIMLQDGLCQRDYVAPTYVVGAGADTLAAVNAQTPWFVRLTKTGNGRLWVNGGNAILAPNSGSLLPVDGLHHLGGTVVEGGLLEVLGGRSSALVDHFRGSLGRMWAAFTVDGAAVPAIAPMDPYTPNQYVANTPAAGFFYNPLFIKNDAKVIVDRSQFFTDFNVEKDAGFRASDYMLMGANYNPQIAVLLDANYSKADGLLEGEFDLVLFSQNLAAGSRPTAGHGQNPALGNAGQSIFFINKAENKIFDKGETLVANGVLEIAGNKSIGGGKVTVGAAGDRGFTTANLATFAASKSFKLENKTFTKGALAALATERGETLSFKDITMAGTLTINPGDILTHAVPFTAPLMPKSWSGTVEFGAASSADAVYKATGVMISPTNVVVDRGVWQLNSFPFRTAAQVANNEDPFMNVTLVEGATLSLGKDVNNFKPYMDLTVRNDSRIRVVLRDSDIAATRADAMGKEPVFEAREIDYTAIGYGEANRDRRLVIQLDPTQLTDKALKKGWIKLVFSPDAVNWNALHFLRENSNVEYEDYAKVRITWTTKSDIVKNAVAHLDENSYTILLEVGTDITDPVNPGTPAPTPTPEKNGPEIDAPATVEPGKTVTFTLGDWYSEGKKLAAGDVKDIVWMLDGKDVTAQVKGNKLEVNAPAAEGTMTLEIKGKLVSDPTKELSQKKSVTVKKAGTTPTPTPEGGKSSGGGCDAGFGGLALALAAAFLLKRKA